MLLQRRRRPVALHGSAPAASRRTSKRTPGPNACRKPHRSVLGASWCVGAVLLATLAAAPPAAADPLADRVFARIAERLALMRPVAAWKRVHGGAIEDPAREAIVLEKASAAAVAAGLVAGPARAFFAAQIEAAKEIQRCWIARWDAGEPPPEPALDLRSEIRPMLVEIGAATLADIQAALASGMLFDRIRAADFAATADLDCLSPAARDAIYRELSALRLAD